MSETETQQETEQETATGTEGLTSMAGRRPVPRACPAAASLQVLGERWTLLAIREMGYGVHRFEQITRFTGASRDILADRLRKLEEAGVVERRQYSEHPPRFEYHLTESGQEARPILLALAQWGERWALDNTVPTFTHACGHPLDAQISCRHCGEPVTGDSLRVRPEQSA